MSVEGRWTARATSIVTHGFYKSYRSKYTTGSGFTIEADGSQLPLQPKAEPEAVVIKTLSATREVN
jgi:hypothetical protein